MKLKIFLTTSFLVMTISSFSQNTWEKWTPLLGEWEGTGAGRPGQGAGTFTFSYDLDRKIITRKSHSEYPAAENKPKIVHDDLMVIYIDGATNSPKAIYFDNEGHTITYNIVYKENSIVLTGEKILNAPIFRLTYTLLTKSEMNTKFEMSPDGQKYTPYIEGRCTKIR